MTGFNYKDYKVWANNLKVAESEFDKWLKRFLLTQAQICVAECKQRQRAVGAIDTGFMINSWVIGNETKKLTAIDGKYTDASVSYDSAFAQKANIRDVRIIGDSLEVTIGNTAEYSSFIEYGQRSYEGKYILTISIDKVHKAIPNRFENAWKKFLKSKGVV